MNAFEFGVAVGQLEKQAVNFTMEGNLPAVIPGQGAVGPGVMKRLQQVGIGGSRVGQLLKHHLLNSIPMADSVYKGLGAAGVAGALLGRNPVEGAGRGVGYGAGAMLGSAVGEGLGKTVGHFMPSKYRDAARFTGAGVGAGAGLLGAGKLMGSGKKQEAPAPVKKALAMPGMPGMGSSGVAPMPQQQEQNKQQPRGGIVTDPSKLQQMNQKFQSMLSSGAAKGVVQNLQPRPFTQSSIVAPRPQGPVPGAVY